jgi:hypothetical protein
MNWVRPYAGVLPPRGVCALALLSSNANASPAALPLELEWTAPEECPSVRFIESEVTRVVGRPWAELGVEWRQARALITPEAGGYRLQVNIVAQTGAVSERSVVAASCTEAAEAAVAILTAGMAAGHAMADAPAGTPDREATARGSDGIAEADGAKVEPTESSDAGVPAVPLLNASVGVDFGTLAVAAPFAELTGGVDLGRFAALAFIGATSSVLGQVDGAAAGAQMFLWMGGLLGCVRMNAGDLVASGCGGVELGSLQARGFGTAEPRDQRAFWSAGIAEGVLDWYITETSLVSLGVAAVLPFRHLQVVAGPERVHRTPDVAARPWLGLGLRFR